MKLAILGATGKTGELNKGQIYHFGLRSNINILIFPLTLKPNLGLEAVKQALESGHNVTAIVRNPSKLSITNDKLNVVEADVFDADSYKEHLVGHDAVLSCLGFPPQKPKVT